MNIAKSALTVNQFALNVVSNNVANMNTEGYSKQRVNLATRNIAGAIGDSTEAQIRANGGVMMKPYIVSSVTAPGGASLLTNRPSPLTTAIDKDTADFVKDLMIETVERGTGTNAKIWGLTVGGKTGTAENEKTDENPEKTHALFVSFAEDGDKQIAVSVILEYAGSTGGSIAAPIAREVMRSYMQ